MLNKFERMSILKHAKYLLFTYWEQCQRSDNGSFLYLEQKGIARGSLESLKQCKFIKDFKINSITMPDGSIHTFIGNNEINKWEEE